LYKLGAMSRDPLADPEPLIRRVYSYAAYRLGPGADAEDVTSTAIERALRYRASFDPRKGSPQAWLLGIARACVDDHLRDRAHRYEEPLDRRERDELEHEAVLRLSLGAALGALDDADRELIALRYGADLSTRQMAALLEVKANAVDVALHRARERLRRSLEDVGVDAPRAQSVTFSGPAPEPSP
jgi:RNA polymerase sigma factor (sigma-70 family)